MRRFVLTVVCLCCLIPARASLAGDFDCARPPYGIPLSQINDKDNFVKFMEKGGVSYYNYTGPCRLGVHERLAPVIVYGVVDGKLYSRIMKTDNDDIEIIKTVTTKLAGAPKTETEGDWLVMSWDFPEKAMRMKLKYNNVTRATKSALYYEPLREKLAQNAPEPENALDQ